jgi:hypothetical protein
MRQNWLISRRTMLRGLGTTVALPWLDVMEPLIASAAPTAAGKKFPVRMVFAYVPNGIHMADWTPEKEGALGDLPATLEPLKAHKKDLLVLTGLSQKKANANGDGPGDHARAMATFLTGCQAKKTNGSDIRIGVSVDQVAAQKVGQQTKFASLELGCDPGQQAGNCDSGYSCAYSSNISWKSEATPLAKEINPRLIFERLFSESSDAEVNEQRAKRERQRKSVLDFVLDDASRLKTKLGAADVRKMDEYLTSVRELERRVSRAVDEGGGGDKPKLPQIDKPTGIPSDYAEHIRLIGDLMVLSLQADLTRVATFVFANESSGRSYPLLGVKEGHHDLSHHGKDPQKQEKIKKINLFHTTQLAYVVDKMASVKEGSGTLLDHSMLLYGSGIGDGDRHNHNNLPILLVGKGGGSISTGRHVKHPENTPLANLFLSMLDRVGAPTDTLGDSTGRLKNLES